MAPRGTVHATTIETVAFRYSNYDTPFWVRSNTEPGRWHALGAAPTQYLSLTTDGAWAELIRREDLRSEADVALVRTMMWQARIDQSYVVDYSSFELAEAAGFAPEALVDDDQSRCRAEGARLRALGYNGVLSPCAALPDAISLTLFGPRVSTSWNDQPRLASAIPAAGLAQGAPPNGLAARVRFQGHVHSGLAAYQRAQIGSGRPPGN
jgi:hypothetical protein